MSALADAIYRSGSSIFLDTTIPIREALPIRVQKTPQLQKQRQKPQNSAKIEAVADSVLIPDTKLPIWQPLALSDAKSREYEKIDWHLSRYYGCQRRGRVGVW